MSQKEATGSASTTMRTTQRAECVEANEVSAAAGGANGVPRRERFAELDIDSLQFVAIGEEADGLADPRRERAVTQVVLEHPAAVAIERTARRHGLDQMLPDLTRPSRRCV